MALLLLIISRPLSRAHVPHPEPARVRTCLSVTGKTGSCFTVRTCSCCSVLCLRSSAFTEPQPHSASVIPPPLSLLQSVCLYSRPEPLLCNKLAAANILLLLRLPVSVYVCLIQPASLLTAAERPCPCKLPFNSICCVLVSTSESNFLCERPGS